MSGLINQAIPTDKEALKYLEEKHGNIISITASYAKYLYKKGYIKSHRNFKCSTQGCNAPITCRSIKPESRNSPTFQDQITSENLHKDTCPMNPKNRVSTNFNKETSKPTRKYKKDDEIHSTLQSGKGFKSSDNQSSKKSSNIFDEGIESENKISKRNKGTKDTDSLKTYIGTEKLETLQDHVQMYESDPDFKIISGESQKQIPIKYMFRSIISNNVYEKRNNKYPCIYYGDAYLQSVNDKEKIRVQFSKEIKLGENECIRPSFFIEKKHLEDEYPDIYEKRVNQNKKRFRVYTTLPLKKVVSNNITYLNLASFDNGNPVRDTSDELKDNFYIS